MTREAKCKGSAVERLMKLGFSEYEAKAYVALLAESPVTGYKLSRLSGVPPSMIYEVVGKLVARGAAMTLRAGDTNKYAPVPATALLERFRREHGRLIASLKEDLATLVSDTELGYIWNIEGHSDIVAVAEKMIGKANSCIRLAPSPVAFPALQPALGTAIRRGVRVVIHGFSSLGLPEGQMVIVPMSGAAIRCIEGPGLILVVDGEKVLMGEWGDRTLARALWTRSPIVVFIAQRYLRTILYLPWMLALLGDRGRDLIHEEDQELFAQAMGSCID